MDNILVPVGDLTAAREFYGFRLGLRARVDDPERDMILFDTAPSSPGLLLHTAPVDGRGGAVGMRVWLEVEDVTETVTVLRARGVHPMGDPYWVGSGEAVELADPWGNVIGLTDYSGMEP